MSPLALAAGPAWLHATCAAAAVTGLTSRAKTAMRASTTRIGVILYLRAAVFNTTHGPYVGQDAQAIPSNIRKLFAFQPRLDR